MTDSMTQNNEFNVPVDSKQSGLTENTPMENKNVVYIRPLVDVREDEKGIVLYADLPGVDNHQLKIEIDGDTLLIEADVDTDLAGQRPAKYRRSFTLSRELDSGAVEASLTQGLLTLHIPKRAEVLPRRIEVKAA